MSDHEAFQRAMLGLLYSAFSALLRNDPQGLVVVGVVLQYMSAHLDLPHPPPQTLLARLAEEGQAWADSHPLDAPDE